MRAGQIRAGQIRAGQIRAGQIRAGQIRAGQIRAGQMRAGVYCGNDRFANGGRRFGAIKHGASNTMFDFDHLSVSFCCGLIVLCTREEASG